MFLKFSLMTLVFPWNVDWRASLLHTQLLIQLYRGSTVITAIVIWQDMAGYRRAYMEVFVIMIQSIFHLKSQRQRTLRLLFEDCRFIYLHSLMRSTSSVPESGFTFGGSDGKARVIAQINNKFINVSIKCFRSSSG